MKRLGRKSFPREPGWLRRCEICHRAERLDKNYSFRHKACCRGLGDKRRGARESLARRFVRFNQPVLDPQDLLCGNGRARDENPPRAIMDSVVGQHLRVVSVPFLRELSSMTGSVGRSRRFLRICRGVFADIGIGLVGPLPLSLVAMLWAYFGEEHFSPHGRACWCRLCRSVGPARFTFLEGMWDVVSSYLLKMPLHALYALIVPVPLKTAIFILKKVRQWWVRLLG